MRKITPKKGNIMAKHKNSLPVRTIASVLMIPTAISMIPKIVKEEVKGFVSKIDDEIEQRKTVVNLMTD